MKKVFLSMLFSLAVGVSLMAQDVISIRDVEPGESRQFIEIDVFARRADRTELLTGSDADLEKLKVSMRVEGNPPISLQVENVGRYRGPRYATSNPLSDKIQERLNVLFLLDLSGSMRGQKLTSAKSAIYQTLSLPALNQAQVEFAWFHDDISPSRRLTLDNYDQIVGVVDIAPEGQGKDTDLYRAIREKLGELSAKQGKKILIVLTDGKDETDRNPHYQGYDALTRITRYEILSQISGLDSTYQIFPVGVGDDADKQFLEGVAEKTQNQDDYASYNVAPSAIQTTFKDIVASLQPNWTLYVPPPPGHSKFGAEGLLFSLSYEDPQSGLELSSTKETRFGSATTKIDMSKGSVADNFWIDLIVGISVLILMVLILNISVPMYNDYQFKRDYIRSYGSIRKANVEKRDPLTNETLQDSDMVVAMEGKMMLLDTWKYFRKEDHGIGATEYGEFFQYHTTGGFFSQQGLYRRLNWLWFGALGGLLAWIGREFLDSIDLGLIKTQLAQFDTETTIVSNSIFLEVILGPMLGMFIVGALAFIEERGQSRKFSVSRIILRMLVGLLAGLMIFFLEGLLIAYLIPSNYVGGLIGWALFGTVLGFIVTLFSGIESSSGIKGGAIAGVIAFHVYFILNLDFISSALGVGVVQVVSLIIYGAILGFVLFTVVAQLEDFELKTLAPKTFAGRAIPISKWLKSPSIDYISIGKDPSCYVYLKWDDPEAKRSHARLTYNNNLVYIQPDEGDVFINGNPIKKKVALGHQDKIQLGERGTTAFQFQARDEKPSADTGKGKGKGGSASTQTTQRQSISVKRRNPKEVKKIRDNITINRKS